jgi:hypothetical protein
MPSGSGRGKWGGVLLLLILLTPANCFTLTAGPKTWSCERLGASCEDWEFAVRIARTSRSVKVKQILMRYNYHSSNASFKYRNLLQKELLIENTLLAGTVGLNRMITQRKVRAASYALQSIFQWPLPSFLPKRFKTLLVELSDL